MMHHIMHSPDNGQTTYRETDESGKPLGKTVRLLASRQACRLLGKTLRHFYRYVERGWISVTVRFANELFFDEHAVQRLKSMTGMRRPSLPPRLAPLFPDYDLKTLHAKRDADIILGRLLERGTRREVRWALRKYSTARRCRFLVEQGHRLLTRRTLRFWAYLWGVKHFTHHSPLRSHAFFPS